MTSSDRLLEPGVPPWAARSDDQHMVALGGMEKEELRGLDIAVFSRAPPEAMLATLQHLRCAGPYRACSGSSLPPVPVRHALGEFWLGATCM